MLPIPKRVLYPYQQYWHDCSSNSNRHQQLDRHLTHSQMVAAHNGMPVESQIQCSRHVINVVDVIDSLEANRINRELGVVPNKFLAGDLLKSIA